MNRTEIQNMLDGFLQQDRKDRASTQMTLGKMIKKLEAMDSNFEIKGLGELDSYRGYYSDLAFEPIDTKRTVSDILAECRNSLYASFEGYKGGFFDMDEDTPLWLADYGDCGPKLMGIRKDGTLITEEGD